MRIPKKRLVLISGLAVILIFHIGSGYFNVPRRGPQFVKIVEAENSPIAGGPQTALTPDPIRGPGLPNKNSIKKIPILMYHHIGDAPMGADATYKNLTVSATDFDQEVGWLKQNGYASISLYDIYLYSRGQFSLPAKPVVFSFDDGYSDVFQNAVPILKKYGYSGSFGIITQFPGTISGNNIYATWDEIQAAHKQGMEIACHTQNHFDGSNPKFDIAYIYNNLSGCKQDLQNHNIKTNVLIYPYGHYTPAYIEQAQAVGFVMGVTVRVGPSINLDDLMQVPRVRVHSGETLQRFEDIILERPLISGTLN